MKLGGGGGSWTFLCHVQHLLFILLQTLFCLQYLHEEKQLKIFKIDIKLMKNLKKSKIIEQSTKLLVIFLMGVVKHFQ